MATLKPGIYRYLPLSHQLFFEFTEENLANKLVEAIMRHPYPGKAAATFI